MKVKEKSSGVPSFFQKHMSSVLPYGGMLLVVVLFSILSDGMMLSQRNLTTVFNQMFPTLLICIGATFYWAHGSIDLSIGNVIGVAGILAGVLINNGMTWLALLAAIGVALVFALVNSVLITYFKLPSFLATLCVMFVANGIQSYFTLQQVIYLSVDVSALDTTAVKLITVVLVTVICCVLFNFTSLGKNNVAIGGNPQAAYFSGVKVRREQITAFLLAGVCVGLAAFFMVLRMKSVTNTFGSGMQFNVMTSMVLGGTVIGGGKNTKISNGIIGAVTYQFLTNGLTIAGLSSEYVYLVKGIVFIAVVAMTFKRKSDGLLPV